MYWPLHWLHAVALVEARRLLALRVLLLNGQWDRLDRLTMKSFAAWEDAAPLDVDGCPADGHTARAMKRVRDLAPPDLEPELEAARLDLLALFRALDRLDLTADEIPQDLLRDLFELDADFAEALHVLDFPARGLDVRAMLAYTRTSLRSTLAIRQRFLEEDPTLRTTEAGG